MAEPSCGAQAEARLLDAIEPCSLPRWDLGDLYGGIDDPRIACDLESLAAGAERFAGGCRGRLKDLAPGGFHECIEDYARLVEGKGRVGSYAELLFATSRGDARVAGFHQMVEERLTSINGTLLFFELEINRLSDAAMEALLAAPETARYRTWLEGVRAFRPHQLCDDAERMLNELSVVQESAWTRLFDETVAGLRFSIGGETLNEAEALDRLAWPDGAVREEAGRELSRVFRVHAPLFAHITNTLARTKGIKDGWRSFARPISPRNLENRIEDETVDALVRAVRGASPRLAHRYYAMKARWFGRERLSWWDRNAPLSGDDDRLFEWHDARRLVLEAFGGFSGRMSDIAATFFERNWIDARVAQGKDGGAFSHPVVPSAHPYVLLNYQGRMRDVMTLAHELGHGVHQVLAAGQGPLLAPTPLTLAETASVFGEQLAFRHVLERETDPGARRRILAGKVEDMLNTVVRQVAFCEFETRLHDARKSAELTPDDIGDIWMVTQGESLGSAVDLDDDYRVFWCYIPHFVHSPFYVYAYAFGDCLVNALWVLHRKGMEGFEEKFHAMLEAGGSLTHGELLRPFGLDAARAEFWSMGLDVIAGFIDELEALDR